MEKPRLFVKVGGKEYGPYDADEIKALIREDRFGLNDFVRREGEASWFRAGNIASLKALFEPASAPAEPKCPACGTLLESDAAFCTECGTKVTSAEAAPPPPSATATCPQCGAAVEEGDVFCGECGGKLAAPPPEAKTPTAPEPPAEEKAPPAPPPPAEKTAPPEPAPSHTKASARPSPVKGEAPPAAATPTPPPPSPFKTKPFVEAAEPAPPKRRVKLVAAIIGGGLLLLVVLIVAAFFVTDYLGGDPLTQGEEPVPAAPVMVEPPSRSVPEVTATLVSAAGGGRSSAAMAARLAEHDDGVCEILEAERPGSLTLDLTVTSDGRVMTASVVSSTYGSAVNKRVENAARRWNFGDGRGVAKLKVKCKAAAGILAPGKDVARPSNQNCVDEGIPENIPNSLRRDTEKRKLLSSPNVRSESATVTAGGRAYTFKVRAKKSEVKLFFEWLTLARGNFNIQVKGAGGNVLYNAAPPDGPTLKLTGGGDFQVTVGPTAQTPDFGSTWYCNFVE
jgi:outer membrane biosynthesis protein TonB